jgi:hypothetical protein
MAHEHVFPKYPTIQVVIDKSECDSDCPHLFTWTEDHPYGSTTAYETLSECTCEEDGHCPVVQRSQSIADGENEALAQDQQA